MPITQYSKFGLSYPSVFQNTGKVCCATRSSGSDLTRAKHFGGSDPTYQVFARFAQLFLRCSMVVNVIYVGADACPFPNPQ